MKSVKPILSCLLATLLCLAIQASVAAGPISPKLLETRASHLGCLAAGLGTVMHMADYLHEHSGVRTAIFAYLTLDSPDTPGMLRNIRWQAEIQDQMGREFWPQVALETRSLSLTAFIQEMNRPGSRTDTNVRAIARAIAQYRYANKWFFIRPFCEMNDATQANHWEFGDRQHHNTPALFAAAWKILREHFDQEGAANAIFIFSPLAAYGVHREAQTLSALNLIPRGSIDAFGLNVYSRPLTAYGGRSPEPISFEALVRPWLEILDASKQRGIPLAVPEMAVSNQASDTARARWVRDAFKFARSRNFVMVTYYNYRHRYWQINFDTLAGDALKQEMNLF